MDEPTGGLDVSVQARLPDLLLGLMREMGLSAIVVIHDLAAVRLLADRLLVIKDSHAVEVGLADQVLEGASLKVALGECVALTGAPGTGKSTLLRVIFGSYLAGLGQVLVSEPLLVVRCVNPVALGKAAIFLKHLNNPEHLCLFNPTTFSGSEPQRVNIARGFAHDYPVMLLDEPTASLNARNRESILLLIEDAKARGAAIVGIFRDEEARNRVSDREVDVSDFTPGLAA